MSCNYCGELFVFNAGMESTSNKPKVLNCQHILCSNCLGAQIRTLPEEYLVMIICPFCAEPTVKEIPTEVSLSQQDISRCSSYDSDISMSNIDTTPIDFHRSRSRIECNEDDLVDRGNIHPLPVPDFDELNESTNLDMPTYDGIYQFNEHINDSTELDQDNRIEPEDANAGQIEFSSYEDPVQLEISELESFAHWTLIAMDLSILLFVILDLMGGLDELARRGLFYMHTSASIQNMAYGLLLLHLFLQELPNSSLSQSYQLGQGTNTADREKQHVNAHVAALLVVLDLAAVLALFASANRSSLAILWNIIQLEVQNIVTTGTVSLFGGSIIVLAGTVVFSIVLGAVLFVQAAVEQENAHFAPRSGTPIRASPFAKSPIGSNTTEIDEHTRRILRRHNVSTTRSSSASLLPDLRINITTTAHTDSANTTIHTVRTGVYSPRLYATPTPPSTTTNQHTNIDTSSDAEHSENESDNDFTASIPRIDSDEVIYVSQSRDDDWVLDQEERVDVEYNFDDIYAHSQDEDECHREQEQEETDLVLSFSPRHIKKTEAQTMQAEDLFSPNSEVPVDDSSGIEGTIELCDVYANTENQTLNSPVDIPNIAVSEVTAATVVPEVAVVNANSNTSGQDVNVVGDSCVYSPLRKLRITDLSLSPLSPTAMPLSTPFPDDQNNGSSEVAEDSTAVGVSAMTNSDNSLFVSMQLDDVEVPLQPDSLSLGTMLLPLSSVPPLVSSEPVTPSTTLVSIPSLPLSTPIGATKVRSRRKKGRKPWHKKDTQKQSISTTDNNTTDNLDNVEAGDGFSEVAAMVSTGISSGVRRKAKYPLDSPQTVRALRKSLLEGATNSNSTSENSLTIPGRAVIPNSSDLVATNIVMPHSERTPSRKTGRTTPDPEGSKKLKVRTPEPLSYSQLYERRIGSTSIAKNNVDEVGTDEVVDTFETAESIGEFALVPATDTDTPNINTTESTILCINTTSPSMDAYSDSEGSVDSNSTYNSTTNVRTVRLPQRRILQTQQVYPEPVDMSNLSMNVSINTLAYGSNRIQTTLNIVGYTDNICNTTDASVSLYKENSCADYTVMDDLVSPTVVAMYKDTGDNIANTVQAEESLQVDLLTHIDSTASPTITTKTIDTAKTIDTLLTAGSIVDPTADSNNPSKTDTSNNNTNPESTPVVAPEVASLIPSPRRTVAFNAIAQAYIDKISGSGSTGDAADCEVIDKSSENIGTTSETTPSEVVRSTTSNPASEPIVDTDATSVVSSSSAVSSRYTHTRSYSLGTTLLLNAADDIETMFETLAHDVEVINHTMHDLEETTVVNSSHSGDIGQGSDVLIRSTVVEEQTGVAERAKEKGTHDHNDPGNVPFEPSNEKTNSDTVLADEFVYPDLSSPKPPRPASITGSTEKISNEQMPLSPFSMPTTPNPSHTPLRNININHNATSPEMSGLDLSRIYPVQDECMYDRNDIPDPVNDVFETYSDARLSSASSDVGNTKGGDQERVLCKKPSSSKVTTTQTNNPLVTKRSAANVVYSPYNYTAELPATTLPYLSIHTSTASTTATTVTPAANATSTPATSFTPITANHSASMYSINSTNSNSAPRSRSNIRASIREKIDIRLGKTPQARISSTTSTDDPTISVTTPTLNTTADVDRFEDEMHVFNLYASNPSIYSAGMNSGGSLGRNPMSRTHSMEHNEGLSPTYSSFSSANRKEMVTTGTSPLKMHPAHVEENIDPAELGNYMPSKTLNPSLLRYHQQQQQFQQHQHASQVDLLSRNSNSIEHNSHTSVAMAIVAEMQEEVSTSPPIKLNADVEHHTTHNLHNNHSTPSLRPVHSMYSEAGSSVTDSNASSTHSSMYDMSSVRNVTSPYNFDSTPVRVPTPVYTNDNPNVLSSANVRIDTATSAKNTPPTSSQHTPNSHYSSGMLKNMAALSFYSHHTSTNTSASVASNSNMVRPSPLLRPATTVSTNQHTLHTHSTQPVGSPALRKHASMNTNNITAALSASKNAINMRARGINNTSTPSSAVNTPPNTGTSERGMAHSASNYSLASNKSKGATSLDCVSDAMDSSSSYVVVLHMNQALTTHRCIGKIAKCITAVVVKCQERKCPVVVLVSLPSHNSGNSSGGVNTVYSYLYAVPNSRATAYDLNSTETIEYIVKVRSKPCWLIPPVDSTNSPTKLGATSTPNNIHLTERMFRSTLSALVNLDTTTNRSTTTPLSSTYSSKLSGGGVNSPYSPDVDPRVLYENHLNGLRNEIKTALGAFTSTSDVVAVCDGTCWPFQSPPHIANQSAALSNWLLYRTSVPYLQFHFVAISTVSASGSISGTKSVESK